jgi:hypothetical protein
VDVVSDAAGLGRQIGRLRIPVLDQLVVLGPQDRKLDGTPVAKQQAERRVLVAHDGRPVCAPLDSNSGPRGELVGDLIDEWGGMRHPSIVSAAAPRG